MAWGERLTWITKITEEQWCINTWNSSTKHACQLPLLTKYIAAVCCNVALLPCWVTCGAGRGLLRRSCVPYQANHCDGTVERSAACGPPWGAGSQHGIGTAPTVAVPWWRKSWPSTRWIGQSYLGIKANHYILHSKHVQAMVFWASWADEFEYPQ